eukprot:4210851-Pyramimonas_sp.AAC.4
MAAKRPGDGTQLLGTHQGQGRAPDGEPEPEQLHHRPIPTVLSLRPKRVMSNPYFLTTCSPTDLGDVMG